METQKITSLSELSQFAGEVLSTIKSKSSAQVIGLQGDLGSGKTALTKEFAKVLGIEAEITSPTFVVMKTYSVPKHEFIKTLVHIDAYRIESDDEMKILHFDELLEDDVNLIIIEWPEQIESLIPKDALRMNIEIKEGETREFSLTGYGKN